MKNTFGSSVALTIFGESHGIMIGGILDGLAAGIPVDEEFIASQMSLRKSVGDISTARKETDAVRIVSGVFNGRTTHYLHHRESGHQKPRLRRACIQGTSRTR